MATGEKGLPAVKKFHVSPFLWTEEWQSGFKKALGECNRSRACDIRNFENVESENYFA